MEHAHFSQRRDGGCEVAQNWVTTAEATLSAGTLFVHTGGQNGVSQAPPPPPFAATTATTTPNARRRGSSGLGQTHHTAAEPEAGLQKAGTEGLRLASRVVASRIMVLRLPQRQGCPWWVGEWGGGYWGSATVQVQQRVGSDPRQLQSFPSFTPWGCASKNLRNWDGSGYLEYISLERRKLPGKFNMKTCSTCRKRGYGLDCVLQIHMLASWPSVP